LISISADGAALPAARARRRERKIMSVFLHLNPTPVVSRPRGRKKALALGALASRRLFLRLSALRVRRAGKMPALPGQAPNLGVRA